MLCKFLNEWILLKRQTSFWLGLIVLMGFCFLGVGNGAREVNLRQSAWQEVVKEEERKHNGFTDKDAGWAGIELGYSLRLPPRPLAALSLGQSDIYPEVLTISTFWLSLRSPKETLENPVILSIGKFDMAYVIVYIVPLIICILFYDIVSSEYESGIASIIKLKSTKLYNIAQYRIFIRMIFVAIALFLTSAFAMYYLGQSLNPHFFYWFCIAIAWSILWSQISLLINSFRYRSANNAVILFLIWVVINIFLPNMFSVLSEQIYPLTSRGGLIVAIRNAEKDAEKNGDQLLQKYYAKHPERLPRKSNRSTEPQENSFKKWILMMQEADRKTLPTLQKYWKQQNDRQNIIKKFLFLLPSTQMHYVLNHLSGTNSERYLEFEQEVTSYNEKWSKHFQSLIFADSFVRRKDMPSLPRFSVGERNLPLSSILFSMVYFMILTIALAFVSYCKLAKES